MSDSASDQQNGTANGEKPKRKNIFDIGIESSEAEKVPDAANTDENARPKGRRPAPVSALKSGIYRSKVKQHKFKVEKKTHEELFQNAEILAGPEFRKITEDLDKIEVEGGDGTKPLMNDFSSLIKPLQQNLKDKGIEKPTLVQRAVMPIVLRKKDYDLMARAQTGTGKTGAFLWPIIHLLERGKTRWDQGTGKIAAPHVIVLSPTRELAQQLFDAAATYTRDTSVKAVCSYGEMDVWGTVKEMANGCDILVCTMGRIVHLLMKNKLSLANLKFLVLDEADKLVTDPVFFKQIKDIVELASVVQGGHYHRTLLLSATLDSAVMRVADEIMNADYFRICIDPEKLLSETVEQQFVDVTKMKELKVDLIVNILKPYNGSSYLDENGFRWCRLSKKVVIFCNSCRITNWLALKLTFRGLRVIPTNGTRSQMQRRQALEQFERGEYDILVSTSVIARGMNIPGLDLVINFDMPKSLNEFTHRTGRTGRAGNLGEAITLIDTDIVSDNFVAKQLVQHMIDMDWEVPETLLALCVWK